MENLVIPTKYPDVALSELIDRQGWFLNCAEELGHLILIYQIPLKSFLMNLITYSVHDEQLGLP
jgi:hypothetical protein